MIAQLDAEYIKRRPTKALQRLMSYALFEGRPVTTRGRWINPLVFTFFNVLTRTPLLKRVEKPIFILGTGRSGTTILGKVLSMHAQVGFLNEPKALWHTVYPGEDLIGNYSLGPARYCLTASDANHDVIRSAHRLFGAYLMAVAARRVVDKYPELIFRIPFVRTIFPDARFVLIMRNGWDTVDSIAQWSMRLATKEKGETHDWWGVSSRKWYLLIDQIAAQYDALRPHIAELRSIKQHTERAALEWALTMDEGLKQAEQLPDVFHLLRYEDLTTTPEKSLLRLLAFCDLPADKNVLAYGCKVLAPVAPKAPCELHAAIQPLFVQMMQKLDYVR